jgi:chromate transport protein ChrA
MEGWKANLIEGAIFLVVGLAIIIINSLTIEAIDFLNNGNQITASLNPIFVVLLISGFFLLGVGTAQSAVTITIRKFERAS